MKQALLSAESLAARMPALILQARRLASQMTLGLHGRKKPGIGEEFWQFRRFDPSEDMRRIDWRKSARDSFYSVRERELEVAHRFNIWPDLSLSMQFGTPEKREAAIVLALVLADILNDGGEKISLAGLTPPFSSRKMIEDFAEHISRHEAKLIDLPVVSKGEMILLTDGFGDFDALERLIKVQRTHLIVINDSKEESFPYSGRVIFEELEEKLSIDFGRVENVKIAYLEKLKLHREKLKDALRKAGGTCSFHNTSQAAAPFLLKFLMELQHG